MNLGGSSKSLEDQLVEQQKKEQELIKLIDEKREEERIQDEHDAKVAEEKRIILEKQAAEELQRKAEEAVRKAEEEELKRKAEEAKKLQLEQEAHARKETQKEIDEIRKIKESQTAKRKELEDRVKDHPKGCMCNACSQLREQHPKGCMCNRCSILAKEAELQSTLTSDSTQSSETKVEPKQKKKSKFSFKRKPKPEVLKKADLDEYHKVKKDPDKLLGFIKKQRTTINKQNEAEKIKDVIKKEGAIDAKVKSSIFTDVAVLGLRLAIGFSFIAHGLSKMDGEGQMFIGMLQEWGVPMDLAFPIALAELVAGILITTGILTRISSVLIGVIMLGAIFVVKGVGTLIGQGGIELDVIVLAAVAVLGIFGPGRLSVSNIGIKGLILDRKLQ